MRKLLGRLTVLAGCLLGALLFSASPARAGLLYSQPDTISHLGYFNTYTSSYLDSNYNYYVTADNFTLASNSTITGISWQGTYLDYNSNTGNYGNGAQNTSTWEIQVYDANFNLLTYQDISSSSVTETYAGTANFYNGSGNIQPINYYNNSTQLSTGISLQANQTYYLAIFSINNNPSFTDFWSWMSGYGGDGSSYQYNTYSNDLYQVSDDRAFSIFGVVPEPSSLVLVTISMSFLAGYSWRSRKSPVAVQGELTSVRRPQTSIFPKRARGV